MKVTEVSRLCGKCFEIDGRTIPALNHKCPHHPENKKYTEKEIIEIVDKFEKEHTKVLRTEDIIDGKIVISDYIKWNDFRKLKSCFKPKT